MSPNQPRHQLSAAETAPVFAEEASVRRVLPETKYSERADVASIQIGEIAADFDAAIASSAHPIRTFHEAGPLGVRLKSETSTCYPA